MWCICVAEAEDRWERCQVFSVSRANRMMVSKCSRHIIPRRFLWGWLKLMGPESMARRPFIWGGASKQQPIIYHNSGWRDLDSTSTFSWLRTVSNFLSILYGYMKNVSTRWKRFERHSSRKCFILHHINTTTTSAMRSDPLPVWHHAITWFGVGPVVISSLPPMDAMSAWPSQTRRVVRERRLQGVAGIK